LRSFSPKGTQFEIGSLQDEDHLHPNEIGAEILKRRDCFQENMGRSRLGELRQDCKLPQANRLDSL
jgi:hypothetical protein